MTKRDEANEAVEAGELQMVYGPQEPAPFMAQYPDFATLIGRMKTREAECKTEAKAAAEEGDIEMENFANGFAAGIHAAISMLGRDQSLMTVAGELHLFTETGTA